MPIRSATAAQAAPAGPPPASHPMDPCRGEDLSLMFTAVLCWLLQLPPMTKPAITGIAVSSGCVLAATDADPFHNTLVGAWDDLDRNLRGWGAACGADPATVEALVAKVRSAGR